MRRLVAFLVAAAALAAPAAGGAQDLERAKKLVSGRCFLCHGAEGEAGSELFPRLAGQHPAYLAKQLKDFRDGRRKGGGMEKMAEDLKDEDIAQLGLYFSGFKAAPFRAEDRVLASTGRSLYELGSPNEKIPPCAGCHGRDAAGTASLPRLAGQQPDYLARQLKYFSARVRTNDNAVMHDIAVQLTETQIRALAAYLGELE
jgi:cytochrome c553